VKRSLKTLKLNRDTLRTLTAPSLRHAAAGDQGTAGCTAAATCPCVSQGGTCFVQTCFFCTGFRGCTGAGC
jgi:hypothetical protein